MHVKPATAQTRRASGSASWVLPPATWVGLASCLSESTTSSTGEVASGAAVVQKMGGRGSVGVDWSEARQVDR